MPACRPFRLLAISQLFNPDLPGRGLQAAPRWLAALAAAGVDALQLREKALDDRAIYQLAVQARTALPLPASVLVNGRTDIALAAGCDGVHLPADGLPAAPLRGHFGAGLLLGVSTHRLDEVELAQQAGADYVLFGPIYGTPGKAAPNLAQGPRGLALAAALDIPVYALGGVTLDRFTEVAAAGAAGVAAIRLFQRFDELEEVVAAGRTCFP